VTYVMISASPGQFRRVFLVSAVPSALALFVLAAFVRSRPAVAAVREPTGAPARPAGAFGAPFRRFLVVAGLFSLGNSSTALLLLLAKRTGWSDAHVMLLYFAYNMVYTILSWPIGELSDRIGRRVMLFAAYLLFGVLYLVLAHDPVSSVVAVGLVVLGVHSALLEGSQRSMIGDLVPADRRATAYGYYYSVVGLALFPASAMAGWLWTRFVSPSVWLRVDGVLALAAAALFLVLLPPRRETSGDRGHAA
jgi:MFS family permease